MDYLAEILMAVIALEGLYLCWRMRQDRPPPWPEPETIRDGRLPDMEVPRSSQCGSLGALVDFIGCAMRVQYQVEDQRFVLTSEKLDRMVAALEDRTP